MVGERTWNNLAPLLLLVIAPITGVAAAMVLWPGSILGQVIWAASKGWMILLPVVWHVYIDRGRISFSPMRRGGWIAGFGSGLGIFIIILIAYHLLGRRWIDHDQTRDVLIDLGLNSKARYFTMYAYWVLVNSVLEEYVWRWFVYRKCESLLNPAWAVIVSAGLFTVHHVLALQAYFDWRVTLLASAGVFVGGATWSCLYLYYRSIWPGWISHAWADLAIFVIGYKLIFM